MSKNVQDQYLELKNYTLNNVIDVLKPYCIDLGESGKDNQFGYGVINLKNIILKEQ